MATSHLLVANLGGLPSYILNATMESQVAIATKWAAERNIRIATVVATTGEVLITNLVQNQDLFWAIRGGGGGQYGIVMEFVIKHYPQPAHVAFGETATKFNPAATNVLSGVVVTQALWAIDMKASQMDDLIAPLVEQLKSQSNNSDLTVQYRSSTVANYSSFYGSIFGSNVAGGDGVMTSRLLGRKKLVDLPRHQLREFVKRGVVARNSTSGTFATVGLSGGPGVINAPPGSWGALHSAWQSAYLHLYVGGASASMNDQTSPRDALEQSATWIADNKEDLWREWAPTSGFYMNEEELQARLLWESL
ncbi:hypothetical protein CERZMDRAFT_95552 [Cercospora zeae-maydis SCOH1-5]|uniref:Berberine/berberine-like domain-containing protein n=1 Tax=Cercospora zeae-maydis SCOH1-5 TaxID=717836 RepID=A0A6A6FLE1_9PEZI|nr:hypothetical protein CERZMDRAFT_95552 [Cercospora zeae-maydis SCOH1-5]